MALPRGSPQVTIVRRRCTGERCWPYAQAREHPDRTGCSLACASMGILYAGEGSPSSEAIPCRRTAALPIGVRTQLVLVGAGVFGAGGFLTSTFGCVR